MRTGAASSFPHPFAGEVIRRTGGAVAALLPAMRVAGETIHRYSGAATTPDDQIGLFTALSDSRARLELPYPEQKSTFDMLELKR